MVTTVGHAPYVVVALFLLGGVIDRVGYLWLGRDPELAGRLPRVYPTVCVQLRSRKADVPRMPSSSRSSTRISCRPRTFWCAPTRTSIPPAASSTTDWRWWREARGRAARVGLGRCCGQAGAAAQQRRQAERPLIPPPPRCGVRRSRRPSRRSALRWEAPRGAPSQPLPLPARASQTRSGAATTRSRRSRIATRWQDAEAIFERFSRGPRPRGTSGHRPGAGLGLAIARAIAEAHQGVVRLSSQPGHGATFGIELPVTAPIERRQP